MSRLPPGGRDAPGYKRGLPARCGTLRTVWAMHTDTHETSLPTGTRVRLAGLDDVLRDLKTGSPETWAKVFTTRDTQHRVTLERLKGEVPEAQTARAARRKPEGNANFPSLTPRPSAADPIVLG